MGGKPCCVAGESGPVRDGCWSAGKGESDGEGKWKEAVCVCCCLCWGDVGDPKWQGEGRPGKVSVLKVESVGAASLFFCCGQGWKEIKTGGRVWWKQPGRSKTIPAGG